MSACSGLIAYLDLISSDLNRSAFTLLTHDLSHYMKLDSSAVRALTLMPDANAVGSVGGAAAAGSHAMTGGRAGKDSAASLFGLLNKCKTGQGTRLLAMWLKQPLVNLHQIGMRLNNAQKLLIQQADLQMQFMNLENRQQLVQSFFEDTQIRMTLRVSLKFILT